jgi:protein-S-isoprenylcysteine O-methyltransferase Ste14
MIVDNKNVSTSEKAINISRLKGLVLTRAILAFLILGLAFFVPAGTLRFWEAWVYIAILMVPMSCVMAYLLKKDPELLERRMRTKEKETVQKQFVLAGYVLFAAGYLLPGFDRRFGWSSIPPLLIVVADVMIVLGYLIFVRVILENRFLSRVVEVEREQKVISTGPYAVVRHPMYSGTLILYLFTPLGLGSYWALIPFVLMAVLFPVRILNEEHVLLRDLEGYRAYAEKTKYRLIPGLW